MKKTILGFTLVELLVGLVLMSIGLLTVIAMMRSSIAYTDKTRQEVLAINLAREGMESVYVIRNTNRLRRSGIKDINWLCTDSNLDSTGAGCSQWMSTKSHRLLGHKSYSNGEVLPVLLDMGSTSVLDLSNGLSGDEQKWGVYYLSGSQGTEQEFNPTTKLWLNTTNTGALASSFSSTEGRFYRSIINKGLYQKDTNVLGGKSINCTNGSSTYNGISITGQAFSSLCGDSHPKEFRFCSRVEYEKQTRGKVELCGIITNYEE